MYSEWNGLKYYCGWRAWVFAKRWHMRTIGNFVRKGNSLQDTHFFKRYGLCHPSEERSYPARNGSQSGVQRTVYGMQRGRKVVKSCSRDSQGYQHSNRTGGCLRCKQACKSLQLHVSIVGSQWKFGGSTWVSLHTLIDPSGDFGNYWPCVFKATLIVGKGLTTYTVWQIPDSQCHISAVGHYTCATCYPWRYTTHHEPKDQGCISSFQLLDEVQVEAWSSPPPFLARSAKHLYDPLILNNISMQQRSDVDI